MAMNDPHDRDRAGNVPPRSTRPADIPVERRDAAPVVTETARRSSPLKWLIPLLLLLVIGFALTRNRRAEPEVAAVDPSSTQSTAQTNASAGEVAGGAAAGAAAGAVGTNAVQQFVTWANEGGNAALPQESEENHPYTTQGLRLMADALGAATTGRGGDFGQRVTNIRNQADRLQTSSGNDEHAQYAHSAFVDAAKMIGELRGTPATELTQAANVIQPGRPLSPQGTEVRAFFRQAATALQGMQTPNAQGGM